VNISSWASDDDYVSDGGSEDSRASGRKSPIPPPFSDKDNSDEYNHFSEGDSEDSRASGKKSPIPSISSSDRDSETTKNLRKKKTQKKDAENLRVCLANNLVTLAEKFHDRPILQEAKAGADSSYERVLIALATLLMEKTTCAAVFISPNNRLWIGTNKKDKAAKVVISPIQKLLSSTLASKSSRVELIKDGNVRDILGLSANQGRKKNQYNKELIKSADKMIHWVKKVLLLKEYLSADKENEPLGIVARCLRDDKIDYFFTDDEVHAEMNLINELYNKKLLDKHAGYIGISKACCLKCASALEVVNSVLGGNKIYTANGCHFHVYDWPTPNFIKDDKFLEVFVGKEAFKIYKSSYDKRKKGFFQIIATLSSDHITKKTVGKTGIEATTTESPNILEATEQSNEATVSIKKGKRNVKMKLSKRQKNAGKQGAPKKRILRKEKKGA